MFRDLVYAISGQFPERDDSCRFKLSTELELTVIQASPDQIDLHGHLLQVDSSKSQALLIALAAANFGLIATRGSTLGYLGSSGQVLLSRRMTHLSNLPFEVIHKDALDFIRSAFDWRRRLEQIIKAPENMSEQTGPFTYGHSAATLV
jgi:hypothetical protein